MSPFDLLFKKKKEEEVERHPLLGRRQGEQGWLEDGARLLKEVISSCDGRGCYPIQMFSVKEIEQAIGPPFHEDGIYVDYEGTHEDRQIIIKVYRIEHRQMAFNEIATVTQMKHANVGKLLGCCFEMEQPILIFEKVPFILSNRLFKANPSSSIPISWDHRLRIAIELSYAITYLHIGTSRPIVHRDIKCSNILLDEHFKPKLFDFSLSIAIPLGETQVETIVAGTFGYMDPAYFHTSFVSEKTDVYSYGVVLLELLSGKGCMSIDINNDRPLLKFIVNESTGKEERLELILHNGLSMDVRQVEQAMACMEVAVKCISRNPDERPAMKEVAQQLEQIERASSSVRNLEWAPKCPCGYGYMILKTSHTAHNQGQRFWKCPDLQGERGCGLLIWMDEVATEYASCRSIGRVQIEDREDEMRMSLEEMKQEIKHEIKLLRESVEAPKLL